MPLQILPKVRQDAPQKTFPLFVCCETDFSTNLIKARIQEAEQAKVHTLLVTGGRDLDAGNVFVRLHGKGPQGAKPKAEVVADIVAAIKDRMA